MMLATLALSPTARVAAECAAHGAAQCAGAEPGRAPELPRISVSGKFFIDESRRVRIFHGFNDVDEAKDSGPFDGSNYLPLLLMNETRVAQLTEEWGFNCFRLPVMWAAAQPGEGVINASYLDALFNATRLLASYGAHSLLDMHQDSSSSRWEETTYDGVPRWIVDRTVPRHAFPWPYKSSQRNTATAAMTEAVGQQWHDIYHNVHGGMDAWVAFWSAVGARFRNASSILGYGLVNEPWVGDPYTNPFLLLPGIAGWLSLAPTYDLLAAGIRRADDEAILFYEPVSWGMMLPASDGIFSRPLGPGLSHVPGGRQHASTSAYSFHYYCWFSQGLYAKRRSKWQRWLCDWFLGPLVFESVGQTMATLGGASFLSEFGGRSFTPDDRRPASAESIEDEWLLTKADAELTSWAFWELSYFYDPNPTPPGGGPPAKGVIDYGASANLDRMRAFIRPYARAVAGIPTRMHFDPISGVFRLSFQPDGSINAPTEVFVPPLRYPAGFNVSVAPANSYRWRMCKGRVNVVCLTRAVGSGGGPPQALPSRVVVMIRPAGAPKGGGGGGGGGAAGGVAAPDASGPEGDALNDKALAKSLIWLSQSIFFPLLLLSPLMVCCCCCVCCVRRLRRCSKKRGWCRKVSAHDGLHAGSVHAGRSAGHPRGNEAVGGVALSSIDEPGHPCAGAPLEAPFPFLQPLGTIPSGAPLRPFGGIASPSLDDSIRASARPDSALSSASCGGESYLSERSSVGSSERSSPEPEHSTRRLTRPLLFRGIRRTLSRTRAPSHAATGGPTLDSAAAAFVGGSGGSADGASGRRGWLASGMAWLAERGRDASPTAFRRL